MNEAFEVLAVRSVNFEDKKERKQIIGLQLWVIHPSLESGWNGHEILKIWIPDDHPSRTVVSALARGDSVSVQWNRYGRAVSVSLA